MRFFYYETLPSELADRVAQIHERIPLTWDPSKSISEDKIYYTAQKMISSYPNQIFIIVENEFKKIVGFHWVKGDLNEARVLSTWVDPNYRGQGLASKLKSEGENLIRQKFSLVTSKVHKKNKRMIKLNLKFGYFPVEEKTDFILFKKIF